MTENISPETPEKACGMSSFNYCFWAKLCVALPALAGASVVAASQFHDTTSKYLAIGVTVFVLVYAAVKIDQIPALSKKIVTRKPK